MRIYQMTEVKPKYTFKYFLDNGYIKEVTYTQNFLRKKSKIVKTDRFRLSTQMIFRITGFYEMYMMMLDLDEGFLTIELIPDRMVKFINDLERESNQIIAGKLSPDKIEMFKKMID